LVTHIVKIYHTFISFGLHGAVFGGAQRIVDYILSISDINLNTLNMSLYYATLAGQKGMIDYLLSLGSNDVNNILIGAVEKGHQEIIEYVISLGANLLETALYYAIKNGHIKLIPYLISQGATDLSNSLFTAIENNQYVMVKYLLIQGPILKQQFHNLILPTIFKLNQSYVLLYVIAHNDFILSKYLLSIGINDLDDNIYVALLRNQLQVAKYLLINTEQFKKDLNSNIYLPTNNTLNYTIDKFVSVGDFDMVEFLKHYQNKSNITVSIVNH